MVAAALVLAGPACGGDDDDTGGPRTTVSPFVPVRPLTRASFHAFVVAADARVSAPGTDPEREIDQEDAQRLYDALCSGEPLTLFNSALSYPSQAAAYEQIFDAAEAQCAVPATSLDRARGEAAWNMTRNQLALDRLLEPDAEAVSGFCDALQATDDITSTVVAEAAEGAGLVPEGSGDLLELGVSFLIQACPELLDLVRG